MIDGEGRLCEALAGKDGETNIIVGATVDELGGHLLGRFDTVGLEVLGKHTGGHVDGKHDVNTLDLTTLPMVG